MKAKRIYAAMLMVLGLAAVSCDPDDVAEVDPSIEVSPAALQVGYESSVEEITVTANTGWNLFRTDSEGNEISWVKVDKLSGKGSCVMHVKVLENAPKADERRAVIRFEAGSATAYLDIVQAANPNEPPVDPDIPDVPDPVAEGYDFPMVQRITTGQTLDITSGKIAKYPFDQMPVLEAKVEGSKVIFDKGLVIEASAGSFTVARPAHTNPTRYAGFQEALCLEGFESGTITYTIPLKEALSGKVRFLKGQRREKSDTYSWSSDGGTTFTELGAATAGASDASWKYLDFEIPAANAVPAGGKLIIKESVTFNADTNYGGIMMACGVSLQRGEGELSSVPAQDATSVVFSEGFDDIAAAPGAALLDYGFMNSWTSGKRTAGSYTPANTAAEASFCYSRPGFLQIGYADEAMAFSTTEYYVPGTYSIKVGERLKEMDVASADLTVSFKARGIINAYEEGVNAEPVLAASVGTVSDGGKADLSMTEWKEYSFTVGGADQTTVLTLTSNSANVSAKTGKADNRFFIDDVVVTAGGSVTPPPTPSEPIVLTFDFTCEPQSGWPQTDSYTHVDGGTSCTYKLDGKDYTFVLADCNGASACRVFWKYEDAGKWLALNAKYRYVGLPAIEGYKLVKLAFVHASATSSKRAAGVCKAIEGTNVLPDADGAHGYVSGGESMATPDQGTEYAFNLSQTEVNTVYYFMCTGSGIGVGSFTLTYEAAE